MAELLFGSETEYALAGLSPSGRALAGEGVVAALMDQARRHLVHLPDLQSPSGLFLANGSRLYLDCGTHPELATPECMNPWDAVRYIEAGHAILSALADAVQSERHSGTEILLLRTNVDLSGSQSTWGCHESYLHRRGQDGLRPHLVPHLITRILYTGAGGFDPCSPGLVFMLSPRAAHIRCLLTGSSTMQRGIWHAKTEPLSAAYRRLHVLCGESECSHTAMWLKFGITALIVAMADAGLEPGNGVQTTDPVAALQTVARDPTCSARLPMQDGGALTAIDIQRHYLRQAEANLGHDCMPPWAGEVCVRWRAVLDRLESGAGSVDKTLDWAIKLRLYASRAGACGIRWDRLPVLNQVIEKCWEAQARVKGAESTMPPVRALESVRDLKGMTKFKRLLDANGLCWEDVRSVLAARDELFETETRFSQLGQKGIFANLDRLAVLDHRFPGVDNIEHAMAQPPATGRANTRGRVVSQLANTAGVHCDWQSILDGGQERALDLSDPFSQAENWKPMPRLEVRDWTESDVVGSLRALRTDDGEPPAILRREQAYDCFVAGDYAEAESLLRGCLQEQFEVPGTHCHLARVLVMAGRELEARVEIERAWEARSEGPAYVRARILFFQCLFAMLDRTDFSDYVRQIKTVLSEGCAHWGWTIEPVIQLLRGRLCRADYRFACALAEALCGDERMRRLNRFAEWRNAAVAVDTP